MQMPITYHGYPKSLQLRYTSNTPEVRSKIHDLIYQYPDANLEYQEVKGRDEFEIGRAWSLNINVFAIKGIINYRPDKSDSSVIVTISDHTRFSEATKFLNIVFILGILSRTVVEYLLPTVGLEWFLLGELPLYTIYITGANLILFFISKQILRKFHQSIEEFNLNFSITRYSIKMILSALR